MNSFAHTVIEHMGLGVVFATSGIYVRNMCNHLHHKILVGGGLLLVESVAAVALIG